MHIDLSELVTFLSLDPNNGVILVDNDYVLRDISPSALTMLASKYAELINQDIRFTLPQLFSDGLLRMGDFKLRCGQYVNLSAMSIADEDVQLLLLRDISENVMHGVYQRVLNFLRDSIVISDEEGYILQINDSAVKSEGITNKNARGMHLSQVYRLYEEDEYLTIKAIRTKKSYPNVRQVYGMENGKLLDSLVSTYPIILDDKLTGAVCIMEDYAKIDTLTKKILELQSLLSHTPKRGGKKSELIARYTFNDIVSRDPQMVNCIKKCKMAAKSDSSVLIYGETGTGKELFAQSIHNHSQRCDRPFIAINCAAIPENLLEGMLFGTVSGAYTGAQNRPGLLEQADGGTLLLDEINSMPITLQSKLLRVLQDGYIRRLGGTQEQKVNVRIISNINTPPAEAIRGGLLRQDLFYRLGAVSINIPPLRERPNDIDLLAKSFIIDFNEKMGKSVVDISTETAELFHHYSWPGNVRELQHAIEHAMNIIPDGNVLIRTRFLPESLLSEGNSLRRHKSLSSASATASPNAAEEERQQKICQALRANQGNISRAAAQLGVSRQNLQYYLKKQHIDAEQYKGGINKPCDKP